MNVEANLFVAYVAALIVPLMFQSLRVAVLGLGIQGMLLGAIVATHNHPLSSQLAFEYANLFIIRGIILPGYIFHLGKNRDVDYRLVLLPPYLFQWFIAAVLVLLAFLFGAEMSPDVDIEMWQVGTAASSLLIGLLILSHQSEPLGQVVGLFTIEGGIALIELLSPHAMPFPVAVGVALVFVLLMLTCGTYVGRLPAQSGVTEANASGYESTL